MADKDTKFPSPDFRALFEKAPGLFLVLDPGLRIVAASDAYLEATLTRREAILGRHIFDVFPDNPEDPEADSIRNSRASFQRVLQTREPDTIGLQRHDVRRPESEGGGFEVRYWSAVNYPLLHPDGSLAYIMHKVENVTDFVRLKEQGVEQAKLTDELREQAVKMEADLYVRSREMAETSQRLKQANEELERLYAKTRELDELKSRFFANMSHELRTPLTLILGPVRNLLVGDRSEEERRDLAVVERNARTLLKHVNDLLDLSKLDAGGMGVEYAQVDLVRLARFVASHFEVVAAEKEIRFSVEMPESLRAEVDAAKLQRVLFNLLANAFKFTPPKGAVRLTLRVDAEKAAFAVEDTGPGIPAEMREAIFERFRQVDGGPTRRHEGTGLGLAIVREFVHLHRGTIQVAESDGGGARLAVEVPLNAPEGASVKESGAFLDEGMAEEAVAELQAPARLPAPRKPEVPAEAPLVLVIEDNREMSAYITRSLGDRHRIAVAFDGREGLEKTLRLRPDLIVSDLMMPGMSGEEMMREIRRHPELDEVPILFLTARAEEALQVRLLSTGAQDCLIKPFAAEELAARAAGLVERKRRTEASLREHHALLRAVAEGIEDSIFVKDAQGRYLLLNSAGARRIGKPLEEILGREDAALLDSETAADTRAHERRIMQEGETVTFEETRVVDGQARTYLTTKAPHRDSLGRIVGILGISRDITDRKQAEEALRVAKEAAEASSRAKDTFLVNMNHELRTPLAVSLGNIELALGTEGIPEEARGFLTTAAESGEALLHLLQQILDLRNLQENKVEVLPKPMNIVECCREVFDLFQQQAERKELDFSVRYDNGLPAHVLGDCEKVRQILFHLIGNAIKFTDQGEVEISIRRMAKTPVDDKWPILFQVRDTGIGMPVEMIERLYLPFSQADTSLTRRFGGTGVGLAISKGLVEKMGGEIRVESEEGKGSVFSFILPFRVGREEVPASPTEAESRPQAVKASAIRGCKAHILIVEDEPMVSSLLRLSLVKRGWHALTAANGREALEVLDRERVDLILMDLKMPVMDGFEATRRIRQREKGADIPIVAMTAHARPEVAEECRAAGIDDFLTKPATMHQLYGTIERHLQTLGTSPAKEQAT